MKRLPVLLSLVLVFALLLSACSTGQDEQEPGAGTTPGAIATDVFGDDDLGSDDLGTEDVEVTEAVEPTEIIVTEAVETEAVEPEATEVGAEEDTEVVFNSANLSRLSSWLGYNLEDSQGEDLGEIDSLVIDHQAGQVVYALVDPAAELELASDGLLAVPFSTLEVRPFTDINETNVDEVESVEATPETPVEATGEAVDDADVVDVEETEYSLVYTQDRETLAGAPTLIDDDLNVTVADWDVDVRTYWSQQVAVLPVTGADGQSGMLRLRDASDLQLVNAEGEDIGDVDELIVTPTSGTIDYFIWAQGGFLGIGEDLIPVPFERLEWRADVDEGAAGIDATETMTDTQTVGSVDDDDMDYVFVLNVDTESLENAPSFGSLDDLHLGDPNWDAEIAEFWNSLR